MAKRTTTAVETNILFLLYSLLINRGPDTHRLFLTAMERLSDKPFIPDVDVRVIRVMQKGSDLENFTKLSLHCEGRCRKGKFENPEIWVTLKCHDEGGIVMSGDQDIIEG